MNDLKTKAKRGLSLLLAILMSFSLMMPQAALAADTDGGEGESPTLVISEFDDYTGKDEAVKSTPLRISAEGCALRSCLLTASSLRAVRA